MAINIPTGTTTFNIDDDGKTYVLQANHTRSAAGTDPAIYGQFGFDDDKIIIRGSVSQTDMAFAAVVLSGDSMVLQVAKTGAVTGNSGVEFVGPNSVLTNAGKITATDGYGVYFEGLNTEIHNSGRIAALGNTAIGAFGMNSVIDNTGIVQGAFGIDASQGKLTITLGDTSKVIGSQAAIHSTSAEATDKVFVFNDGHITGQHGAYAIELADGNDSIVNHGTMAGLISMGSGNDVFDNRGGTVDHVIQGGAGNDTLITDKAGTKLKENGGSEGYDTVKSTVTYTLSQNVEKLVLLGKANINGTGNGGQSDLLGNGGNNKLFGLGGIDSLDGGKGTDRLTGGANADTFVFKTGNGHDTIMDFQNGLDRIDVSHWSGIDNISDVKHHMTASNGDLFITLGSDQLIIADTTKAEIDAGDFYFPI